MLIQTIDNLSLWQQVGFKPHASRQELIAVLADVAEFLKSGKGDQKRGDQVYAQEQLAHVARNRFDDACEEIATRRGWRQYSQKTYQAVAARIWEAKLPSGKDSFHFKFYTRASSAGKTTPYRPSASTPPALWCQPQARQD